MTSLNNFSHRRYNPLISEWVLVSPHRTKRPWQGQNEKKSAQKRPKYDSSYYTSSFYLPFLRSDSVKKFMVGYKMFAELRRDMTPEQAAAKLRASADVYYLDQKSK